MCSVPDMVKVTEKEQRNSSDNLIEKYILSSIRGEIGLRAVKKEMRFNTKDWI